MRVSARMEAFLNGEITIEDLDFDELARGQMRSERGDFSGRPPDYIPRKFQQAAFQELQKRMQLKFQEEVEPSLNALKAIRDNPKAPADARLKSAIHLIERAVGKVPEKNEVKVEVQPWSENIEELFYDDGKDAVKTSKKK